VPSLDPFGAFVDRVVAPQSGDGPIAGIRVAVKDNIAVAGLAWTAGLPLLEQRVAGSDAACVELLRAAGAAIVGTTVTDAAGFGMTTPGVINPLSPQHTAGGSSGGSAAAVAGGLAELALGTDTAGSVRVPAACCGLYGLKPTFGSISVDGVTPLSFTFDHVGLLSRDIETLERGARVLLPDQASPCSTIACIGFDPERLASSDERIRETVERVLSWLAAEGFTLVEIELPDRISLAEMHGTIVCAEARDIWAAQLPQQAARFADTARRSLAYAATLPQDAIDAARLDLTAARATIAHAFATVDAIVGPTMAVPPPLVGARKAALAGFEVPVVLALLAETCPFNVSGNPALSLPLPWLGAGGIPVSFQVAVQHRCELGALGLGRKLLEMSSAA